MNRKTYWKDVRKSFSSSKGRVVSIASLMALGSFALVGLKAKTCEWADMNGTSQKAAYQNKKAKERRKDHENNSGDQLKRWSSEDNDGSEHGNATGDEVQEKCITDRQ